MDSNLTIDEALRHLPDTLKTTLGLLHSADDDVAELTLGTLPIGSRGTLSALGVIAQAPLPEPDAPVIVSLTPFGRELITAAALEGLPPETAEQVAAFEEARARRETSSRTIFEQLAEATYR
jgi:hypothetical protein